MIEGLTPKAAVVAGGAAVLIVTAVIAVPSFLDHGDGFSFAAACGSGEALVLERDQERVMQPKIGGEWVVWVEAVEEGSLGGRADGDVWAYHLGRGELVHVAGGPAMQTTPEVFGSWVAWTDQAEITEPRVLHVMDLDSGDHRVPHLPEPISAPRGLYEDTVLLETGSGLATYDLASGAYRRVMEGMAGVVEIWKEKVVWIEDGSRSDSGFDTLWLHNLTTKETSIVLEDVDGYELSDPDVYEDLVVYMKGSTSRADVEAGDRGDWDIYAFDLATGREFAVATNEDGAVLQQEARVAGAWIVYMGETDRRGTNALFSYNWHNHETRVVHAGDVDVGHDVWQSNVAFIAIEPGSYRKNAAVMCIQGEDG